MLAKIRLNAIKFLIDLNEKFVFERKLSAFYKKENRINLVIDVGANKGQTIDFFLSINPSCEIYAIEPNPELYSLLLKKYVNLPTIKIFNFGISNSSGEKLFFENVLDYTSSFEELNMDSDYLKKKAKILGVTVENIIKKKYPVNVKTLPEFLNENNIKKDVDVLKIDTEGHEFYCLEGLFMSDTLPKIRFIQLENHNDDLYAKKIDFSKITHLLNKNNFFEYKKIKHGFGNFDEIIYKHIIKS